MPTSQRFAFQRLQIGLGVAVFCGLSDFALAVQLDDPVNFQVVQMWTGTSLGLPGRLGALMFSFDGQTLFAVGNSEATNSAVYTLPVQRDPLTQRVTGFGGATLFFSGDPTIRGIDAGLEIGPGQTMFYTYWNAHFIGERPAATPSVETRFDMTPTGVPSSVAGLTFSPHLDDPGSQFALMQVSSWLGDGVYNVPLSPQGGGVYQPGTAVLFVRLPQQGTGALQYVPQGLYTGNLMYVNWDFGEVRMLVIDRESGLPVDDPTGLPMLGTTTPRDIRFAFDMGRGPWGLEFDPLTLDFFVSTWQGAPADSIIQFTGPGFANQAPSANDQTVMATQDVPVGITLSGTDPDLDPLMFSVVLGPSNGTLTGTTANLFYGPSAGFVGTDSFTFRASDGQLNSNTATVTINVGPAGLPDGGAPGDGAGSDALTGDAGDAGDAMGAGDASGSEGGPDSAAGDAGAPADRSLDLDAATIPDGQEPDLGSELDGSGDDSGGKDGIDTENGCSCTTHGPTPVPGPTTFFSLVLLALAMFAARPVRRSGR